MPRNCSYLSSMACVIAAFTLGLQSSVARAAIAASPQTQAKAASSLELSPQASPQTKPKRPKASRYLKRPIQKRRYTLEHELRLGAGILPADPYTKGYALSLGYAYHFTPIIAWEVAHGFYSLGVDTDLKNQLTNLVRNDGQAEPFFPEIAAMVASRLVIQPLYGKQSWLNRGLARLAFSFSLGPAFILLRDHGPESSWSVGADIGLGARLWLSQTTSLRLDVHDVIFAHGGSVLQRIHLHLGVAFKLGGDRS